MRSMSSTSSEYVARPPPDSSVRSAAAFDRRAGRELRVVDADQLEVASVREPRDPVPTPRARMAATAGDGQAELGFEGGRRLVGIRTGDDQVVDATDHAEDPTPLR